MLLIKSRKSRSGAIWGLKNGTSFLATTRPAYRCSNFEARTRNPLKFAGVPKLANRSQPLVGRSSPYCEHIWRRYCCLTSFSDCRYITYLRRYRPTNLCDGVQMANFCILYFQQAACSTLHTCILNSHYGHIMCGSMVDIQSATSESGGEEEERRRNHSGRM